MVPRGEVGLVLQGWIRVFYQANHTAVVITVILTTFVGPVLLNLVLKSKPEKAVGSPDSVLLPL